ncbi:DNA methyltransferase [Methylomonas fluvii]|uniref:DNA methyltransferase n=1 Tax=Methylomonas fluvii TaxID=1854564 RepID=UPI001CAA8351|nr:DNA methyltransferase [Methylomonas fluvii]
MPGKDNAWDNQWRNPTEFFAWLDTVLVEYHRVLKPAGSMYLFAGPHLGTQVELAVARHFRILNHIVWRKPSGRHNGCRKESLRRYFPQTEHIIFAESRKRLPFAVCFRAYQVTP